MSDNLHLDHATRIRLATEYIVADTPEQADLIVQGILTPGIDQYGGATVTLATDGAGTRYVGMCAKELSSGVFGFYMIDITHGNAKLSYSPFCTGRGSISNAGTWIAWKDKDYWWGFIPGFQGYPDYAAQIAALAQQFAAMLQEMHAADQQLTERMTQLEARIAVLEARAPVPGPKGDTGDPGPAGPKGDPGPAGDGGGSDELRALFRQWLGIS